MFWKWKLRNPERERERERERRDGWEIRNIMSVFAYLEMGSLDTEVSLCLVLF